MAAAKGKRKKATSPPHSQASGSAKFPRHPVEKALRIPRAIMEQNAGRKCSDAEAAKYVGVGYNGPFSTEIGSSIKYGFLERPEPGFVAVAELARKALRPQKPEDEVDALRTAVMNAPQISDVYSHYRGENLPDGAFFEHALVDKFNIPAEKVREFTEVFINSMQSAKLVEQVEGKLRVLDVTSSVPTVHPETGKLQKRWVDAGKNGTEGTCFVVMPFAAPIGAYYQQIYEPAIEKAGLKPIRADADIFGTGKIIDQIWEGINHAKVLVAELTTRNPNVFYELGLAHALNKPVVLVSSNQDDVPFDLQHIRVIYYDMSDPFWGPKLIEKIAENLVSALNDPEEAIFERALAA
jgi:hypothetical protein